MIAKTGNSKELGKYKIVNDASEEEEEEVGEDDLGTNEQLIFQSEHFNFSDGE